MQVIGSHLLGEMLLKLNSCYANWNAASRQSNRWWCTRYYLCNSARKMWDNPLNWFRLAKQSPSSEKSHPQSAPQSGSSEAVILGIKPDMRARDLGHRHLVLSSPTCTELFQVENTFAARQCPVARRLLKVDSCWTLWFYGCATATRYECRCAFRCFVAATLSSMLQVSCITALKSKL